MAPLEKLNGSENSKEIKKNIITREDLCRIPDNINFPKEEESVLEYWQDEKVFHKCMELSKGKPKYTFYDGPPFATGLPHYGHILAGTIKDIVTRYAYQQGYHVDRRFGWDCHGLPVEFEIDKLLNIRGPEDVQKMGIAAYNAECRKIVMRYATQWEKIVTRMGRWVDFKNDYKTLYPWYMESIWWVFKQLYDKGLVYQGVKVMPYSTACNTPLSNFESGQNYKEVNDPCVVVALKLLKQTNTYILIWTTTPWTLPSNFACCVNPQLIYVKVLNKKDSRYYILAECRLNYIYKNESEYEIVEKFAGASLKDLAYEPLFNYYTARGSEVGAFRVLVDDYVTEDSGTGVVHNAPYFGEDDYRVCLQAALITKSSAVICPVDESGRFTAEVTHFSGMYVKDADKAIINHLKETGNLVSISQVKHQYPYCWRSDTPLIYKAVPSWFVRVEHMSKQLLSCSARTYWVPEFVKEKRFGNWLKEARDWAVSRDRYWGTPIPIWTNGDEFICIGSIQQLQQLSGQLVQDLHRESIDHIEIPSATAGKPLRRIKAVFDCWFESGSMPFAQQHYPFENEKEFLNNFPADFIAEGIDQTRGWFYTLLVISTALFNQAPFKNLIANGLILAADGQKMSKRKKNYPDPLEVVQKYGADALRLYLINSPVVRAENLRFKEEGVRDVIKDVFLPWYNSFRFLLQNIARYEKEELHGKQIYNYDAVRHLKNMKNTSIMDVWILSFKESLLQFLAKEMKLYHLYTVVPRLTKFIDQLTNWYIRLNRLRLKGELGQMDCIQSLDTLYDVLFSMVKMMAPFTPYITEHIYQRLVLFQKNSGTQLKSSVHYEMMPKYNDKLIRADVEKSVFLMQSVIELGRIMRDRRTWPIKYPVREIIVIHKDENCLAQIKSMENFILSELNTRKMTLSNDRVKYGITMRAEPDHKLLGQRLKSTFKAVMSALKALTNDEILAHVEKGYFHICGERLELQEVRVIYGVAEGIGEHFEAHSDNEILVLMDMQQDAQLMEEGLAREIINRIQKLKKKADLIPTDMVNIYYELEAQEQQIRGICQNYMEMIVNTVKSTVKDASEKSNGEYVLIEELVDIKGIKMKLVICTKDKPKPKPKNTKKQHINLLLGEDLEARYGNARKSTILLENPQTNEKISLAELKKEIELTFGLFGLQFNIFIYNTGSITWQLFSDPKMMLGNSLLFITRKSNVGNVDANDCQIDKAFREI